MNPKKDYWIEYIHEVKEVLDVLEPSVEVDLTINSFGETFRFTKMFPLAEWNSIIVRGYIN